MERRLTSTRQKSSAKQTPVMENSRRRSPSVLEIARNQQSRFPQRTTSRSRSSAVPRACIELLNRKAADLQTGVRPNGLERENPAKSASFDIK